jgi:hypothetical protein
MVSRLVRMLLVCVCACWALAAGATVRVDVEPDVITADESFTVTFTTDSRDEPDFSPLERDFEILGRSAQTSLQIVNGRVETRQSWVLTLLPRHAGATEIPPIDFGSEKSPPVKLDVRPASASDGDIFIVVEANPQPAYVQAQIQVSVRLYAAARVGNATLSELEAPDAVVVKLGDGRRSEENRGGRDYTVYERRYAVFAEHSGTLTLGRVEFAGEVLGRGAFGRYRRASSEPMDLQILPPPPSADSASWLPAESLKLTEAWPVDPPVFRAGEPVKRTLHLRAVGLTAAQLPPVAGAPVADIKQYADQPELEDEVTAAGVTGERVETVVLLPTQPGQYVLPGIEIEWWNTRTKAFEIARIPEREIEVLPAEAPDNPPVPAVTVPAPAGVAAPVGVPQPTPSDEVREAVWQAAAAVLALGWLATALGWWRSARKTRQPEDRGRAAMPARDARAALRALEVACKRDDPAAARRALADWARARAPGRADDAWARLRAGASPGLARAMDRLDRALYGATPEPWRGDELWAAVRAEPKPEPPAPDGDTLAPLNP